MFDSYLNDLIVFTYLHTNSYTKHAVIDNTVIIHVVCDAVPMVAALLYL